MIIVYIIGGFIIFYGSLVFFKLPISRAFFMIVVAVLLTGFIISIVANKCNRLEDIFYIPLTTLYYGLMAFTIAPWAYMLSAIIALKSKKYFKRKISYTLFGAFLGILSLAIIMVIFFGVEHFKASLLPIGAVVGFLTLLIDAKVYQSSLS